jgi:type IV pilus assembly protein PilC
VQLGQLKIIVIQFVVYKTDFMKNLFRKLNEYLFRFTKVPVKEKIFFVQQLNIMVKTGISLGVGLKTIKDQTQNKKLKKILNDVSDGVQKGELLSQGLEKYKNDFGELFINMIKAGEMSGKLEEVLGQLFTQMKKDHEIVAKVRGAMIYPSVVIFGMVGVGIFVMVYVMPTLVGVFNELDADLPLATKVLIGMSNFLNSFGIFVLIAVILLGVGFLKIIRIKKGKKIFHTILLKLPVISMLIKKVNLARFCRTLSSLLKTDIAIIQSFDITSKVLGNQLFKEALISAQEFIKKGQRIEEALHKYPKLFPPVILQMVAVGEETGSLDTILEQTAQFYEEDVNQTMSDFPSLIEPILILVLGVAVGTMAVAVIMPLYSLSQQI